MFKCVLRADKPAAIERKSTTTYHGLPTLSKESQVPEKPEKPEHSPSESYFERIPPFLDTWSIFSMNAECL